MTDFSEFAETRTTPEASNDELATISEMCQEMVDLEKQIAILSKTLKQRQADHRQLSERKVPEAMDGVGLKEIKLSDGSKVTITEGVSATITKADRPEAHEWLKEQGHGELIKEYVDERVHPSTLKAFCREQLAKGVALPDAISVYLYSKAVIK